MNFFQVELINTLFHYEQAAHRLSYIKQCLTDIDINSEYLHNTLIVVLSGCYMSAKEARLFVLSDHIKKEEMHNYLDHHINMILVGNTSRIHA